MIGIPALNESKHIREIVLGAWVHADLVLVVDDGSTDKTASIAHEAGAVVVSHPTNWGVGAAENTIMVFATSWMKDPDILITMDGDGQHFSQDIPAILKKLDEGYDTVAGTRLYEKGKPGPTPWRRVLNGVATYIIRVMSGYHSTDSQTGFRAYRAWIVRRLRYISSDYAWNSEGYLRMKSMRAKIGEVPVKTVWTPPSTGIEHATLGYGIKVFGRLVLIWAGLK